MGLFTVLYSSYCQEEIDKCNFNVKMFVLYGAVIAYALKFTCVKKTNVKVSKKIFDVQRTD